ADRITDAAIKQILSQRHTGFSVFWGKQVAADDEDSRLFLCRYIDRGPISLEKVSVTDDIVTYETKDDLTHEFSPTEFLARVSVHIPNKWEQTVRYYGAYSARTRGVRRKRVGEQVTVSLSELPERKKASRTWAALIKRVYEVDPLVCPKCGGEMKLIAFIQDSKEITKIMDNLGLPHYRAPPPVAPTVIEPYYDDLEHAA
ncbi:MAG: IS91 family transposase, partial [Phycisphaerae bacterium]|nr:IS91 family transposase [Phycisphaerae bacterium]NIW99427.1 IS91 family transposase [Phycisphaerae bacterium]